MKNTCQAESCGDLLPEENQVTDIHPSLAAMKMFSWGSGGTKAGGNYGKFWYNLFFDSIGKPGNQFLPGYTYRYFFIYALYLKTSREIFRE
jgi:hypothetical protein